MKVRISKNGKFAKLFPRPVADKIRDIATGYHSLASASIEDTDPSKKFYIGEGDRFIGLFPNGQSHSFQVVSENTFAQESTKAQSIRDAMNIIIAMKIQERKCQQDQ